jgi:hypothetical protein
VVVAFRVGIEACNLSNAVDSGERRAFSAGVVNRMPGFLVVVDRKTVLGVGTVYPSPNNLGGVMKPYGNVETALGAFSGKYEPILLVVRNPFVRFSEPGR